MVVLNRAPFKSIMSSFKGSDKGFCGGFYNSIFAHDCDAEIVMMADEP